VELAVYAKYLSFSFLIPAASAVDIDITFTAVSDAVNAFCDVALAI